MHVHTVFLDTYWDCTINNIQLGYYYCLGLHNSHNKESCHVSWWNGMDYILD